MTTYKLNKKGVDALIQLHKIANEGKREPTREDTFATSLRPVENGDREKTLKKAQEYLIEHHLHRLFFPENNNRCIQVSVAKIAEDNGNKIGYSLEMLDITEEE